MTWNPVHGCTPISDGCKRCYARLMAARMGGRSGYPKAPNSFDVRMRPDRLAEPLDEKQSKLIFMPSMGDLFHKDVEEKFIGRVFGHMALAYWHTFLLLTKRPKRMVEWSHAISHYPRGDERKRPIRGWPPNVWAGVSVENAKNLWRIDELLDVPAPNYFLSLEPLLGPLNDLPLSKIDWVIVGGETQMGARPMNPDWARSIRNQCQAAGVPFYFKSWGNWTPIDIEEGDYGYWITIDGRYGKWVHGDPPTTPACNIAPVRKVGMSKIPDRFLDGREWNEQPAMPVPEDWWDTTDG